MSTGKPELEAKASSVTWRMFTRVLDTTDRVSYWAIIVAMAMMTLLVSMQVFTRYILDSSIDSADELSRLCFVWAIFLAIPHGIKSGIHVGIDVLILRLPKRWRRRMSRVTALFSSLLMFILLIASAESVADKWQELMPTVDMTAAVFYIAVLICAVHSLMHLFANILRHDNEPSEAIL